MIGAVGGTFGVVGGELVGAEVLEALFDHAVDGLTVSVDASASIGAETYAWDFGDGSGVVIADYSWDGAPHASPSIQAPASDAPNLISNGDFETDTASWYGSRGGVLTRTTAEKHSGSASMQVVTDGSEAAEGASVSVTAVTSVDEVSLPVTLSAWVKAPAGTAMRLYAYDYTLGSPNTWHGGVSQDFTGTGDWQLVSVTANARVGHIVQPAILTASAAVVTFYVDDVTLVVGVPRRTNLIPDPLPVGTDLFTAASALSLSITGDGWMRIDQVGTGWGTVLADASDVDAQARFPAAVGDPVALRVEFRNPNTEAVRVRLAWAGYNWSGSGWVSALEPGLPLSVLLPPGESTVVESITTWTGDASHMAPIIYLYNDVANGHMPVGLAVDVRDWALFIGPGTPPAAPIPYFNGDTLDVLAPFTGAAQEHTYAEPGDYAVTLTVTGAGGAADTLVQTVTVTDPLPELVVVAEDHFDRTVASGFGNADVGGAWGTTANVASVANGEGQLRLPSPNSAATARLRGGVSADHDTIWRLALDKVPNQSGIVMLLRNRIAATSDDEYRLKVRVRAPGAVFAWLVKTNAGVEQPAFMAETDTGLTYTTADVLNVRFLTTGSNPTRLRTRLWLDGQPEPSTWLHDITDSTANLQGTGHVAISNLLSGEATNAPIVVRVLDLISVSPSS